MSSINDIFEAGKVEILAAALGPDGKPDIDRVLDAAARTVIRLSEKICSEVKDATAYDATRSTASDCKL